MLAQSMTTENNWVHAHVNKNGGSVASRVHDFVRMNPPEFLRSQTNEDPQNFWYEISRRSLRLCKSLGMIGLS